MVKFIEFFAFSCKSFRNEKDKGRKGCEKSKKSSERRINKTL